MPEHGMVMFEKYAKAVFLSILVLASLVAILPAPAAAQETTYAPAGEVMSRGSSSGFENMGLDDARVNTKTEGGTTRTGTAWLKPDGEGDGVQTWLQGGASGCVPATMEWCYLDDDPIHDDNGTYITADPPLTSTVISTHDMEQLSVPGLLTSIDSLTFFSWMRGNETPTNALYAMRLRIVGGNACTAAFVTSYVAYQNVTYTWSAGNACGGLVPSDLNLTNVNSFMLDQSCVDDGVPPADSPCTVTATGFVVEYTYRNDFYVDATYSFERLEGKDFRLRWECTTTDDEGLAVYINSIMYAGGGLCAGANATGTTQFDWGGGDITVRLVSPSTTGDITESAYTFDFLLIEGTPTDTGTGVRYTFDCLHLSILKGMWCTDRSQYSPGQAVIRVEWYVQGVKVAQNPPGGTSWLWTPENWFEWGTVVLSVGMRVVFDNVGGSGPLVVKDLSLHNWPRAVATFAVPILIIGLAWKVRYVVRGSKR